MGTMTDDEFLGAYEWLDEGRKRQLLDYVSEFLAGRRASEARDGFAAGYEAVRTLA